MTTPFVTKISQLPAATLPLTGTELVPMVQGGVTVEGPAGAFASAAQVITGTFTYAQLVANYPASTHAGWTAYTTDQGPYYSNGTSWIPTGQVASYSLNRNLTAQAGLRTTQVGSPSINGAPFSANDVSVLLDIGITSLQPRNLWTDVLNSTLVNVNFASAPSGTTGTLAAFWPYATSTTWTVVLSTGQTITGCTFTQGGTSVTFGSSITGSPNTQATASNLLYTSETGSSLSNTTGYVPGSATGSGANGRISCTGFDMAHGATGTVYVKLARQSVSVDSGQSSTSVWYEGSGNTANGSPGSYPPTPWCFIDITGNSYIFYSSEFQSSGLRYGAPGQRIFWPTAGITLSNNPLMGANFDPTYIELIFTWRPITLQIAFTGALSGSTSATLATP